MPIKTQVEFYAGLEKSLSTERLAVYASGATAETMLARYLLNMALCETLYSPLQFCEVALRNRLHQHFTHFFGSDMWYVNAEQQLTPWAATEIEAAIIRIQKSRRTVTAGRIVAELQLGFWTSLFESHYEHVVRVWPVGIKSVFPYMPKSLHSRKGIKATLEDIRGLRNRVFHHERIIHWTDLDKKHRAIIDVIGWTSRELQEAALALDRFVATRTLGLPPWIDALRVCRSASYIPDFAI
jgi:hypothetical protein